MPRSNRNRNKTEAVKSTAANRSNLDIILEEQHEVSTIGSCSAAEVTIKRVVIVGGTGPSALLTALFILRRNMINEALGKKTRYHVTLVDRTNYVTTVTYTKNGKSRGSSLQVFLTPTTAYNDSTVGDGDGDDEEKKEHDTIDVTSARNTRVKHSTAMIGVSGFALDTFKMFPYLFEGYISKIPIENGRKTLEDGDKQLKMLGLTDDVRSKSGYLVDRDAICSALATYLHDMYIQRRYSQPLVEEEDLTEEGDQMQQQQPQFTTYFNAEAVFVNKDYKYIMIRSIDESTHDDKTYGYHSLEYDLLIGCDGENAFIRNQIEEYHNEDNNFASPTNSSPPSKSRKNRIDGYSVGSSSTNSSRSSGDKFTYSRCKRMGMVKTITVSTPKNTERVFMTFFKSIPRVTTLVTPYFDDSLQSLSQKNCYNKKHYDPQLLQLTFAYEFHKPCDDELSKSNDSTIVANYFKKRFNHFEMNWDEIGNAWIQNPPITTGMMICNKYHSKKLCALLLGDEASTTITDAPMNNINNINEISNNMAASQMSTTKKKSTKNDNNIKLIPSILNRGGGGEKYNYNNGGMNRVLMDAIILNDVMEKYNDKIKKVLPAYTEVRKKQLHHLKEWITSF